MTQSKSLIKQKNRKYLRVAGLMSGTSADGIDVAIVDIASRSRSVVAYDMFPYPSPIRKAVLRLCDPQKSQVEDICHYNFLLGRLFAEALIKTSQKHKIPLSSIDLIGSHGQTIYHIPSGRKFKSDLIRSTLQIGEPSVIAEMTGITTVAAFRPRDIACGGQGAPLVPFADYLLFRHKRYHRALQNIGGISNVTFIPAGGRLDDILAFDCGPGNMIIDAIVSIITQGRSNFDRNGAMSERGRISDALLKKFLRHPFFRLQPPKTTGRETFGQAYSQKFYQAGVSMGLSSVDIVATATALTAAAIADSYKNFLPVMPYQVILCGGGARNRSLVKMLEQKLTPARIMTTDKFGISSDAKEAVSFALLAWATIKGIANNVPSATGAGKPALLGKIIPADFSCRL